MISGAASCWQELLQEAESRSRRQSTKQTSNLLQNKTVVWTRKRESYELRSDLVTPSKAKQNKSGKSGAKQCSKVGCTNVEGDGIQFNRIPPAPPDLPDGASQDRKLTHRAKRELHAEMMERIGRSRRGDDTKGLRICNCHPTETIHRRVYVEHDGMMISKAFDFTVVVGAGVASNINPSQASKGV